MVGKGDDINVEDYGEEDALNKAIVLRLIEKEAYVSAKSSDGLTALHKAAKNGHEGIVRLLVEKWACINAKSSDGLTALQIAVANGYERIVQLLIEKGADVDTRSDCGWL